MLRMERFQIRWILENPKAEAKEALAVALKALFALRDLTAGEPDRYVSAAEIAEKARMAPEAVERVLGDLPLAVRENDGEEEYRISGAAAWLPSVLALLRGPLLEEA